MRPRFLRPIAGALLLLLSASAQPGGGAEAPAAETGETSMPAFDAGRAPFPVEVMGERCPYRVLAMTVLPDRELSFMVQESAAGAFEVVSTAGVITVRGPRSWTWRSTGAPGLHPIIIRRREPTAEVILNIFVLVQRSTVTDGFLNGYRIGSYPSVALKGLDIYRPPAGFIEVTEENRDVPVSPHFTLGQFLCKQDGGYPKYLVLRPRLLLKLELLLEHVNAAGHRCDTFHVMSGYRTPFYNKEIGNVKYSRHVWGGAADIFIDRDPTDGIMDDLNRDGAIDVRDAGVLYDLVDELYGKPFYQRFAGGLGRYRATAEHGPFVHVDVRGFRARWGT